MKLTRSKAKAIAVKKAKAAARFRIARDCSDEGLSKEEAAARAGLTVGGLETLLYRETGSTGWPIRAQERAA